MQFLHDESPIIACSTGALQNSAIALIRLSGFKDWGPIGPLLKLASGGPIGPMKPRRTYMVSIHDGEVKLDQGIATYYAAPNSYNGENILELAVHGNLLNVQNIIQVFCEKADFRVAGPGEFTYRALKNKKLSLSQVEGLDLLLNATSQYSLREGLASLGGELHSELLELRESFLHLKAAIELSIDFLDDLGEEQANSQLNKWSDRFEEQISSLHQRIKGPISALTQPEIVLTGKTNAGKSSLFNLLLKNNRSIVSPAAGTTRDYVTETIFIGGTHYKLIDTAGFRLTKDSVEQEGINRSHSLLKRAFFKILMINPCDWKVSDLEKISCEHFDLIIFTHADQPDFEEKKAVIKNLPTHDSELSINLSSAGPIEPIRSSGPIGAFIEEKYRTLISKKPILIERQREKINNIYLKFSKFQQLRKELNDIAVISNELNLIENDVSQLIGITSSDEVLSCIFNNFCIGK